MNKILLSRWPSHGLRLLVRYGLAEIILPELMPMVGLDQGEYHHKDVFEHTMAVVENTPPDLILRWSALLHDLGKPATRAMHDGKLHFYGHDILSADIARCVLGRMRIDGHSADRITKLARMHMRANLYEPDWTDGAVRRLIREAGDEFNDLLILSRADITSFRPRKIEAGLARVDELDERARLLLESENVQQLASPLDGNDLMTLFNRTPGPWIRDIKDYLLSKVLDGELASDDKATAEQLAREFMESQGS
jgi:poly(A) polymerase